MNDTLLYILGIVIVVLGLAISIGLHEFGHLIPAKIFGVKVPHWAIGFGPKLFSKKIGDTEYSFRLIPLGGFITMIGMYPPENPAKPDSRRRFGAVISQSREAHSEHMESGDENRTLWSRPAWQRIIIMLGGPFVNLVLGLALIAGALSGLGSWAQGSKVEAVMDCQEQMIRMEATCLVDSIKTPANLAGLKANDLVKSIDGKPVVLASDYLPVITDEPLVAHMLVVERDGRELELSVTAAKATLPTMDPETGEVVNRERAYVGVKPEYIRYQLPLSDSLGYGMETVGQTLGFIVQFPQQVYSSVAATISGQDRGGDSAISVVGIGQVAGQVTAADSDWTDKVYSNLMLLGSLNLALFAFNMIPLPPLDGGHVAGGIYEYLKRGTYRLFKRKDPGPIDTALMAPLAQGIFLLLLIAGVAMILVDIFNPVSL